MELNELVEMSNRYGKNPDYVLAGGGNTSVKDDESLFVKCSGTQLATITADGFVRMDKLALAALMKKEYPEGDKEREAAFLSDVMGCVTDDVPGKRPSVEALLHSLFPQKYVLHVHPSLINGLTCSKGAGALCEKLFGDKVIWIPLCRPGYTLGRLCFEKMAEYENTTGKKAQVLILQNHGIFIGAESVDEIDALFKDVEVTLSAQVKRWPDLLLLSEPYGIDDCPNCEKYENQLGFTAKALEKELGIPVEALKIREAINFTKNIEAAKPLMRPFTPDHIVYMKPYPLYLTQAEGAAERYQAFEKEHGFAPKIILVEGQGAFAADESESARAKALLLLTDAIKIAVYAESFGGALPMTEELTDFILNWEAESYRSKQG